MRMVILGICASLAAASLLSMSFASRQPSPPSFAQHNIKALETYWSGQLKGVLPKGWKVQSVQIGAAPMGWKRTKGGNGISIHCTNPGVTIEDRMIGPYHPSVTIYVMPLDWEGLSAELGEWKLVKSIYTETMDPSKMTRQVYPAHYLGTPDPQFPCRYHFFKTYVGSGPWTGASSDISRHFKLRIHISRKTVRADPPAK